MSSSTFRKLKRISEREKEGERKLGGRGSAKKKGRMGNQKQKWKSEEEDALLAGVAKHGAGKWKNILKDPEFAPALILRSNIDLKDKWRNLSSSITSAQVTQEKMKNPMIKKSVRYAAASLSLPSRTPPDATVMDDSKTQERSTRKVVTVLIHILQQRIEEPIPHNFKRLLAGRLRSLVSLGKLEKTENGFKIKTVPLLEIKTPSGLATSSETEDDAVHITAYTIADAENKSFLAAEAVKEAERVSKIAEETESMLLLVKEINEQCSQGEVVRLA